MRKAITILTPLAFLVGFGCMGLGVATAADPQRRLPRDNLLVYRGPDGNPVAVKTPEDWAKRRAEIVRSMESVMGKLPGDRKRCPLDMKTENEEDCGKFLRRLVTYASEPVFQLLGHEDHLKVEHPDCAHDFPPEMREAAYKLFDKILGGT